MKRLENLADHIQTRRGRPFWYQTLQGLHSPIFPKKREEKIIKILHTGNTRSSRTCVIKEYQYYTMSLNQYHGSCQYHESMSITWVLVNSMCSCLYHESRDSFYGKDRKIIEIHFLEIQKYKLQIKKNTILRNTEIEMTEIPK